MALVPLRYTQMKSALKMQKVAPQAKAIQEKYKKYSMRDPRKQEMQKEISELYKREGVNPMGGCLPMLPQIPILYAFYEMLGAAIDLRHAHWLWISDLSSKDPYFVLPILLVVSMIFTQRMTPAAGHGSCPAENDELDHAADDGLHLLQSGGGTEPVLCREQSGEHGAAGGNESHSSRPRAARNCGKTGEEERKISLQLSVVRFMTESRAAES